jgi:hypothetical protein
MTICEKKDHHDAFKKSVVVKLYDDVFYCKNRMPLLQYPVAARFSVKGVAHARR